VQAKPKAKDDRFPRALPSSIEVKEIAYAIPESSGSHLWYEMTVNHTLEITHLTTIKKKSDLFLIGGKSKQKNQKNKKGEKNCMLYV